MYSFSGVFIGIFHGGGNSDNFPNIVPWYKGDFTSPLIDATVGGLEG